jgi:tRNA1(Val) A37 N6-methylase TrmN6
MVTLTQRYKFGKHEMYLIDGRGAAGVSHTGQALASIIPNLQGLSVLDLGCGAGYMTIGALLLGASKITAVDVEDVAEILFENLQVNGLDRNAVKFIQSDLFSNLDPNMKFDVIIANLPQHALPATSSAMHLKSKYGGFDGTDIVCKALTEAAYRLNTGGRYFATVSRLTNFKRTFSLAECLYKVRMLDTLQKILDLREMDPYVSGDELRYHLAKLKAAKLIEYKGEGIYRPITYLIKPCEFTCRGR